MEKKILAISEDDFKTIIAIAGLKVIVNAPASIRAIMTVNKDAFSKFMGDLCADIHVSLFSDAYVIGTKGESAEAECFNRRNF